jgi:hypothetical protein
MSVIEDYFTLEKKVHYLEQENQKLLSRLDKLENTFCHIDNLKDKTRIQSIYNNSKKIYSVYQQSKIILMTVCFLFGNKILTNPWILKTIFTIIFKKK